MPGTERQTTPPRPIGYINWPVRARTAPDVHRSPCHASGIPISLGSWWGLLVIAAMIPALIWRLIDEEKFLARNLPGYVEYQKKVRYRLIPLIC
jgi:hypothetical protein